MTLSKHSPNLNISAKLLSEPGTNQHHQNLPFCPAPNLWDQNGQILSNLASNINGNYQGSSLDSPM